MTLIKMGSGAPELELDFGTYRMQLTGLSQKTITVEGEDRAVFEWVFGIPAEGEAKSPVDGGDAVVVNGLTSVMTGPKSKTAAFVAALLGGPVAPETELSEKDLVGKWALGTVGPNKNGYPKVTDLVAEVKAAAPRKPRPSIATSADGGSPLGIPPAADTEDDDLPF